MEGMQHCCKSVYFVRQQVEERICYLCRHALIRDIYLYHGAKPIHMAIIKLLELR